MILGTTGTLVNSGSDQLTFYWKMKRLIRFENTFGGRILDSQHRESLKQELLRQQEEILKQLESESEGYKALMEDSEPKDLFDQASDDVDKSNLEALNAVESKKLQLIENALVRIHTDRYGICLDCSNAISLPRLEAIPYALFCIDCQSKRDKQTR